MRIEVDVDPDRLPKAAEYTGITDRSSLVREAIDSLIQREVGSRLIALGGSDPDAQVAPRRRFPPVPTQENESGESPTR